MMHSPAALYVLGASVAVAPITAGSQHTDILPPIITVFGGGVFAVVIAFIQYRSRKHDEMVDNLRDELYAERERRIGEQQLFVEHQIADLKSAKDGEKGDDTLPSSS